MVHNQQTRQKELLGMDHSRCRYVKQNIKVQSQLENRWRPEDWFSILCQLFATIRSATTVVEEHGYGIQLCSRHVLLVRDEKITASKETSVQLGEPIGRCEQCSIILLIFSIRRHGPQHSSTHR
ncbi:hypothetical protein TNCV_168491 [Trichonephila clavipes]|nr:hypothetical protein TNCV_168491 [Trichonephila clavipes]